MTVEKSFEAELKSIKASIRTYKKKIQRDLANENWKGLSDTARSLHEYQDRLYWLEDMKYLRSFER